MTNQIMNRLKMDKLFREILGNNNVYFQPPESIKMSYPAIRYELSGKEVKNANDAKYINKTRYTLTIIDKNPDSDTPNKIEDIRYCNFDRFYTANNLNHWVYEIYI